jgi:hypothetical protein
MQYMFSEVLPYYYTQTYDFVFHPKPSMVEWVLWCLWSSCMSWHSSDGIVTAVWNGKTNSHCSILSMKQDIFAPLPKCLPWLWDPPNLLLKGYGGCYLGTKQPEHEVASSSSEVKNEWILYSPHILS